MKHNFFIRGRTYALLYFLLYISLSFSQKKDSVDYFPLNVGDRYDYYEILYPKFCPLEYTDSLKMGKYSRSSIVKDTVMINKKKYYIITYFLWNPEGDTVRTDSLGNIFIYRMGIEGQIYKSDAKAGDVWWTYIGDRYQPFWLISRNDTIKSNLGTFINCLQLIPGTSYPIFYFAPNYGKIAYCIDNGNYILGKARIKGIEYPVTNSIQRQASTNENIKPISIYPNPFNSETIIEFKLIKSAQIFIEIVDLLGKRITILKNEFSSAGEYRINWNGKDSNNCIISTGTYLIKIKIGSEYYQQKISFIK